MDSTKLIQTLVMISFVTTMFVGRSEASFGSCYDRCMNVCRNELKLSPTICKIRCVLDCIIPPPPLATGAKRGADRRLTAKNEGLDFCKIGCVSVKCGNIIEGENMSKEKIEGCANSCVGACNKNYLLCS